MKNRVCRFCKSQLKYTFADLGMSPIANNIIDSENLQQMEPFYPLHAFVCESCFLVQLEEFEQPENIFTNYSYFSSYSDSWLSHCKLYTEQIINRLKLNQNHLVVELASNDGYLLQYFKERNVQVLGVEPAENVAQVAIGKNINTITKFFGSNTAQEMIGNKQSADLIIGNNVLAHVPDINDFVNGMKILLKPNGVITMEFPHLLNLIEKNQFDTIYHEHFSYLSIFIVDQIFKKHELTLFDVEEIPTHGGSIRIYAKRSENTTHPIEPSVNQLITREINLGINNLSIYQSYQKMIINCKRNLLESLISLKKNNKTIVAYGAPAKGNTLLNYCGIRNDFIDYTVDRSPYKQGKFLPGTHIPIYNPDKIKETKPNYILILPWNLEDEIVKQLKYIREWGAQFIIPIPQVRII